jgi:hypothetical protein
MLAIFIINTITTAIVILVHYEVLLKLSIYLPSMQFGHRFRVAFGLIGALLAHIIEVWVFGIVYYLMLLDGSFGTIKYSNEITFMDNIYFSFVTYTSLGYGDIIPDGLIRFTAGLEALTGLALIAMTASFMYVQIEKFWSKN